MKREYTARIGSREFSLTNISISGDLVNFSVLGNQYSVALEEKFDERRIVGFGAARPSAPAVRAVAPAASNAHPNALIAPISGVVVSVAVAVGATVAVGEVIAVLEAMKMENPIKSDRAGVIKLIHAKPGVQVRTGEPIVSFE